MPFSYIFCFVIALLIHELGHLGAARACQVSTPEFGLGWGRKICGLRAGRVEYNLHLLPLGAYVRLDMGELQQRPLSQQVLILLAGIMVNLVAGTLSAGTRFGTVNLLLAATNLLPLYQQDGWKCGMIILRALLKCKSALVEWTFTLAGGALAVIIFGLEAARHF